MNCETLDVVTTVKCKAAELSGNALTWAVCQADGLDVVVVVVDGEAQVWHAGDVSAYNPRCHNGRDNQPRFLVDGEPVGVFGSQLELGGEWYLEAVKQHTLEVRPGLFGSKVWSCWGQSGHGGRASERGVTGLDPLTAAKRWVAAQGVGTVIDVPSVLMGEVQR